MIVQTANLTNWQDSNRLTVFICHSKVYFLPLDCIGHLARLLLVTIRFLVMEELGLKRAK